MRKLEVKRIRDSHPQLGTKEECYQNHYKMIHEVAKKFGHLRFHGIDPDDLVSEGTIGLLIAYDRFDPGKTSAKKFSAFAYPYIKGFILRYLETRAQLIHIPFHSGLQPKSITRLDRMIKFKDGTELGLAETIAAEEDDTEFVVDQFICTLTPVEQETVRMMMSGYLHREIGKAVGVSANTIGQYKNRIALKYIQIAQ